MSPRSVLVHVSLVILADIHLSGAVELERAFVAENRYSYTQDVDDLFASQLSRSKRQVGVYTEEYHVTQCNHDNTAPSDNSISVKGIDLQYADATVKAAKLIYLMVRFMPKKIFHRLVNNSAVGLFSVQKLPGNVFDEFRDNMPLACTANCKPIRLQDGAEYDCSRWCTTSDYPYNQGYPLNYLWAYGNFTRTYVVETNIVCRGFNPSGGSENLLIREFGLTILLQALDETLQNQLNAAFAESVQSGTWSGLINVYDYFMKGTQSWFDAAKESSDLGGMACKNMFANDGELLCADTYKQRQYLKQKDIGLYNILNHVYNNNRDYLQGQLSVCDW